MQSYKKLAPLAYISLIPAGLLESRDIIQAVSSRHSVRVPDSAVTPVQHLVTRMSVNTPVVFVYLITPELHV